MSFGGTLLRQETGSKAIELPASKELYDLLNDFIDEAPPGGQYGRQRPSRGSSGGVTQRQSKPAPEDGCMTSQDGDTRTTLSWRTTDRGPMKSVTVSKETVTRPASAFQPETERRAGRQRPLPVDDFPDAVDRRTFGPPVYLERRTFESHTKARTIEQSGGHRKKAASGDGAQTGYPVDFLPDQRRRVFGPQWTNRPTAPRALPGVSDSEEPLTWLEEQTRRLERRRRQAEGGRRSATLPLPRTGNNCPSSDVEGLLGGGGAHRASHETRLRASLSNASLDNILLRHSGHGRHQTTLEPPRFSEEHRSPSRSREAAEDVWRSVDRGGSFDLRRRRRSPFDAARRVDEDVEVISLHPIGCGIYHLEPETDRSLTRSTRSLSMQPQGTSTVTTGGSGNFSSAKSRGVVDQRIALIGYGHHTGTSASFADRKSPANYVTHVGAGSAADAVPESALNTLTRGLECSVLYLSSFSAGNLSGSEALSRSIKDIFESGRPSPRSTVVQFKASANGITLTDNSRRLFHRRFFPVETLSFCASDPNERWWTVHSEDVTATGRAFGFVARKPGVTSEDVCHVLLEIDPTHPVDVIVNFVTNVLISHGQLPIHT